MSKIRIINIIGIDGSGKTTLAKALAEDLRRSGLNIQYKYCQYFAKLLYPIKLVAKLTVMRKTDEFRDYNSYNKTKQSTSSRFPYMANVYAVIWLIDYFFQIFFKITVPRFGGKKIIIDRYIFDIAVNISLTTANPLSYAEKAISTFLFFSPKPDIIIYIDIPDEVAYNRKNDIQDLAYLKERSERYKGLSDKYDFFKIDGTKSRNQMLNDARDIITAYDKK